MTTNQIKVGDLMWHPCSIDIMEHRVTSITEYENFVEYKLKSTHHIGACGIIEIIVRKSNDKLIFVELVDEDSIYAASGLQDFIEGYYYTTKKDARLEYYCIIEMHYWGVVDKAETQLKKAKKEHLRIKNLIKNIKDEN